MPGWYRLTQDYRSDYQVDAGSQARRVDRLAAGLTALGLPLGLTQDYQVDGLTQARRLTSQIDRITTRPAIDSLHCQTGRNTRH